MTLSGLVIVILAALVRLDGTIGTEVEAAKARTERGPHCSWIDPLL